MRQLWLSAALVMLLACAAQAGDCERCGGTGVCAVCWGTGETYSGTCSMCNGTKKCYYCAGRGKLSAAPTRSPISAKIPAEWVKNLWRQITRKAKKP